MSAWTEGITVFVPACNAAPFLPGMFSSLRHSDILEVVVIDCGSSDDTLPIARSHGANVFRGNGTLKEKIDKAANHTRGSAFWFLSPQARPPELAPAYILGLLDEPDYRGGYFLNRFQAGEDKLHWQTWKRNRAAIWLRRTTLHNGPFLDRGLFQRIHGFPDTAQPVPALLKAMRKLSGVAEMPINITIEQTDFHLDKPPADQ